MVWRVFPYAPESTHSIKLYVTQTAEENCDRYLQGSCVHSMMVGDVENPTTLGQLMLTCWKDHDQPKIWA